MILIGMIGRYCVWVRPSTHEYRFTGGDYGPHTIHCDRCMHNDDGLFGRAAVHWDGYRTA